MGRVTKYSRESCKRYRLVIRGEWGRGNRGGLPPTGRRRDNRWEIAVWTSHRLPPTGENNIEDMLGRTIRDGTIYGSVSLYSPREQETTMYVGGDRGVRVWLNGTLIYEQSRK